MALSIRSSGKYVRFLDGGRRGGEIRLANRERNHPLAGLAQGAGTGGHGDDGRDLRLPHPPRDARHGAQRNPSQKRWMRAQPSRRLFVSVA